MNLHDDSFYHDRTWFDELGARCAQLAQRCRPRDPAHLWSVGFALFAAVCVAWAAALATQCVLFELSPNETLAQWAAAGLLLLAARHFLAVTGMSAANTLAERPRLMSCSTTAEQLVNTTTVAQTPRAERHVSEEGDPQVFFRAVKAAGINLRIAYALYAAGFRSAEQVRAAEDAALLAAPGVGPVTVRKLRAQFNQAEAHSSAA